MRSLIIASVILALIIGLSAVHSAAVGAGARKLLADIGAAAPEDAERLAKSWEELEGRMSATVHGERLRAVRSALSALKGASNEAGFRAAAEALADAVEDAIDRERVSLSQIF